MPAKTTAERQAAWRARQAKDGLVTVGVDVEMEIGGYLRRLAEDRGVTQSEMLEMLIAKEFEARKGVGREQ
jgi:hypothetical protein